VRARAVAVAMTWCRDLVVCLAVSLCKDYAEFCVKTTDFR
jgi:hypothetical protein